MDDKPHWFYPEKELTFMLFDLIPQDPDPNAKTLSRLVQENDLKADDPNSRYRIGVYNYHSKGWRHLDLAPLTYIEALRVETQFNTSSKRYRDGNGAVIELCQMELIVNEEQSSD